MSLTEKIVEFAWEKVKAAAESTAEDAAKQGGKSLLSEAVRRIQPSSPTEESTNGGLSPRATAVCGPLRCRTECSPPIPRV